MRIANVPDPKDVNVRDHQMVHIGWEQALHRGLDQGEFGTKRAVHTIGDEGHVVR